MAQVVVRSPTAAVMFNCCGRCLMSVTSRPEECRMGAAESQVRLGWCQVRCAVSILTFHYILIVVAAARASYFPRSEYKNALDYSMRQSEFDKINAALDRAEFALEALQKKGRRIGTQAGHIKIAKRHFGYEFRGSRNYATAAKDQRCSTRRQSSSSSPTGL
jgi:hypothetical protein